MGEQEWRVSPVLGVRDVRRAAEHYRDVLGFALDPVDGVFQPSPDESGVYAIVKRPGVWIHLQIRRGDAAMRVDRPAFERDVYVYVDDVDALYGQVVARGANVVVPPAMAPHGIRELVVADLDGHRLAFGELRR